MRTIDVSRAMLLPSMGDPLLLNLWLKSFNLWRHEVSQLYVSITSNVEMYPRDFILDKLDKMGIKTIVKNTLQNHETNIDSLLTICEEEFLGLIEDDLFVLKPGVIDPIYKILETNSADCVGSTRGCCSDRLTKFVANKFGLTGASPEHSLKQCNNLWPSLFFSKTETLRKTDRQFGPKVWYPSETIPLIDFPVKEIETSDTFVWASIQLRAQGNRFHYIHQHHAGPVDLQEYDTKQGLFVINGPPWTHIGSLSSSITGMLRYPDGRFLGDYTGEKHLKYPDIHPDAKIELCRRLGFFKVVATFGKLEDPLFSYYKDLYRDAVERAIIGLNLPLDKVNAFEKVYTKLVSPIKDL